jgi:predicted DNA binding CopG/RHH family protein
MSRMKKKKQSITHLPKNYDAYDDAELWETGQLGASEEYVGRVSIKETREIHKAIGIESVMVRMPKGLADELKKLAKKEKMGYMPFIREVLDRYVCQQLLSKQGRRRKA